MDTQPANQIKNEQAWSYVRRAAIAFDALDADAIAQEVMMLHWEEYHPKGYWAKAGHSRAAAQIRKHIKERNSLRRLFTSGTHSDTYSSLDLYEMLQKAPKALGVVLDHVIYNRQISRRMLHYYRKQLKEVLLDN